MSLDFTHCPKDGEGRPVCPTVLGEKITILATDGHPKNPIVGMDDTKQIKTWAPDGRYFVGIKYNGHDLLPPSGPTIARGHNPDRLTVEQVGEGWRLLDGDEFKPDRQRSEWIQLWATNRTWVASYGASTDHTHRTRLTRQQLALLDDGWIPWLGDAEPPKGMVEIQCGNERDTANAEQFDWEIDNESGDIIAYRPAKPAIIPWDRDTLPTLPFEVRRKSDGMRLTVCAADAGVAYVFSDGWIAYHKLHANYDQPNGSPCGRAQ